MNQLWAQLGRIRGYMDDVPTKEQNIRLNNACGICNSYGLAMYRHIVTQNPDLKNDARCYDIPVEIDVYTTKSLCNENN